MKTQFAKGLAYDALGNKTAISQFFDPAYLTQSAGFGYQPVTEIKTRLGIGLREVITSQFNQYTDDPTTLGIEKTTVDGGFESVTDVEWNLAENMLFKTQLELFNPLKHPDEVVVRNTTAITAEVNKYISTIFSLQLVNEKRV